MNYFILHLKDFKEDLDYDIRISKKLSYILRHGAVKKKLSIRPDGFVDVQEILRELPGCTLIDINQVVENDGKKRYQLKTIDNILMIKACQGHTIEEVNCLNLKVLTDISFDIIHGTFFKCYENIKVQGLSRMRRNHIHFSKGLNFVCGLRKTAEIFIFINYLEARKNGITFYESDNGVILSPGNLNGFIEPKYFLKVVTTSGLNLSVNGKLLILLNFFI